MPFNLSFFPMEIQWAKYIYNTAGLWVPKIAQQIMQNDYYNFCDSTKYLVNLMADDQFKDYLQEFQNTKTFDEIPKEGISIMQNHFKKMHNKFNRESKFFTNDDFSHLALKEVHSYVKFRNLKEPFDIYNDGRYIDEVENRYELVKKGNKKTKIITTRVPYAKSEEDLDVDPDVKITKDDYDPDKYIIEVENSHVGILNRFAIVVSTKAPAFHSGCFVHINGAGNAIYVYAIELSKDYNLDKRVATKQGVMSNYLIIAGYGFTKNELLGYMDPVKKTKVKGQLEQVSDYIKQNCDVRITALVLPEHEFEEKINWLVDLPEDMTFGEGGDPFDDMFSENDGPSEDIDFGDDIEFSSR